MVKNNIKISIVTPTYNREKFLPRLYNSLMRQTNKNFEWIIVDDGSTDNTSEIVKKFVGDFSIQYIKQQNQGKHIALNKALALCKADIFMCVDSDDYLVNKAVQIILDKWQINCTNDTIVGMVFHRKYQNEKISGKKFPCNKVTLSYNALNYKYNQNGETALVYRCEIFRKFKFHKYENERFMSEEIIYNKIDNFGNLYLCPEAIYVMEYLEDGLTSNYLKNWINNPNATYDLLVSKYQNIRDLNLGEIIIKRIKTLIQYDVVALYSNEIRMSNSPNIFISILCLPISLVLKKTKLKIEG